MSLSIEITKYDHSEITDLTFCPILTGSTENKYALTSATVMHANPSLYKVAMNNLIRCFSLTNNNISQFTCTSWVQPHCLKLTKYQKLILKLAISQETLACLGSVSWRGIELKFHRSVNLENALLWLLISVLRTWLLRNCWRRKTKSNQSGEAFWSFAIRTNTQTGRL